MGVFLDGQPAAEGIGEGRIIRLSWVLPRVAHRSIAPEEVDRELEALEAAFAGARREILRLQAGTEERLGAVEARIFDPQLLMLEDPEVLEGTRRYIVENHLAASKAFDWRMLELRELWSATQHPMVLDRLNDLEDLQLRVLRGLLGLNDPAILTPDRGRVILVAPNLTPSVIVQLDPEVVAGIATDEGTRSSHWAILARSQHIPAVVGLGDAYARAVDGQDAIVDGRIGRLVLGPEEEDREVYQSRRARLRGFEAEIEAIAEQEAVTADGHPLSLRANVDLPVEAEMARAYGAHGVGLFRTEFLVVGRNTMPGEDEQYEGYARVADTFPDHPVCIRVFDLGGDKFPMFLNMPTEENPFLGWRAVRVLLDEPELFRTQIRAVLRATTHGDVRIMVPLVNDVEEVLAVRALFKEEEAAMLRDGVPFNVGYKLGVMIETPAAALDAAELARHTDFFSIGTNDLVQYTLAVDRTNARLRHLFNPFHPSVVRQLHSVARVARAAGIELSVCGEMAATVLGAFLLVGLDISTLSVAWPALPELKKFLREIRVEDARAAARRALAAPSAREVMECLSEGIGEEVDLAAFEGRWGMPKRIRSTPTETG